MTSYTTNGNYPYPDPTDAVTDYPATAATFAGYLDNLPNRNLIINGFFDIWQRGVTPPTTVSGSYTADRWRLDWDGTGGSRSVSYVVPGPGVSIGGMQTFRVGQVAVNTATTGGSFMRFAQRVEGVRSLSGQTASLSFHVLSTVAPKTITVRAVQNFGTGGSPSSAVTTTIGTVTTTTSYARKNFTFTVPSLTGKTIGTNGDDYLEIHFDLGTQTGLFNFWGVQLEQNTTATALERRPLQQELALCQRYYEKSYNLDTTPGTNTIVGLFTHSAVSDGNGNANLIVKLSVLKRSNSVVLAWTDAGSANSWTLWKSGSGLVSATANTFQAGQGSFQVSLATAVNWGACSIWGHWTCSAEL